MRAPLFCPAWSLWTSRGLRVNFWGPQRPRVTPCSVAAFRRYGGPGGHHVSRPRGEAGAQPTTKRCIPGGPLQAQRRVCFPAPGGHHTAPASNVGPTAQALPASRPGSQRASMLKRRAPEGQGWSRSPASIGPLTDC
ncbi:hypothetical protein NDU88_005263 [Pleurodeles waltl]|uniref:Uncharacterized protein n=1 Tax=Pleurodeles waltl TaxID=8319 RepID=A0AAV7MWY9_PLEWA|nr:hypothetical protein NDU88_005263 [Pleurodeles waltl]